VRQSYGGLLIENGLPAATAKREFGPDGITCVVEIDLPEDDNGSEN